MVAEREIVKRLIAAGLAEEGERPTIEALTGGVSSEVYKVDLPGRTICIKRALPKLRVAADWRAPVARSHNEILWLRQAAGAGLNVPEVIAEWPDAHMFAMSWFDPGEYRLWKSELANGTAPSQAGLGVGRALALIHSQTMGDLRLEAIFGDDSLFRSLRIDPFFVATAKRHPDLADRLIEIADRTLATRLSLVHGDVSPKNILLGPGEPVFLDAECACFGDPAFDLAFCATHLYLKSVWKPEFSALYSETRSALVRGYFEGTGERSGLEARAVDLVAALLLARVDGKSPVEYLTGDPERSFIRQAARWLIERPAHSFAELEERWQQSRSRH